MTASSKCAWSASSNVPWISVVSGLSGAGNGTITYSVTANTGTTSRAGTITVGGQAHVITQQGQACTYTISSTSKSFTSAAGTGSVSVTCGSSCAWSAASNATWIGITSGATGTGTGTVSYTVSANTTTNSRTGTLTIGGQTFTVTQQGQACTYAIAPTNKSYDAAAQAGSIAVTCPSSCPWSAASNATWMALAPNSGGSGNGTVSYSVGPNSTTQSRTGTITIAGQTFTVNQAGQGSPRISVSPTSVAFGTVAVRSSLNKTVTISNTGGANLTVSSISLFGSSATHFRKTSTCTTVVPGGSCTIQVTFAPLMTGIKSASMNIYSNDPNTAISGVSLVGTGK